MIVLFEETRYSLGNKNERPLRAKSMIVLSEETQYPLGDKNERPLRELRRHVIHWGIKMKGH